MDFCYKCHRGDDQVSFDLSPQVSCELAVRVRSESPSICSHLVHCDKENVKRVGRCVSLVRNPFQPINPSALGRKPRNEALWGCGHTACVPKEESGNLFG